MTADLEALLCQAYREQADCYERALPLAEEAARDIRGGGTGETPMIQLLALLDAVRAVEARAGPLKAEWQAAGRPPGAEFRAVLQRVAGLIERLTGHVQAAEHQARAHRDRLAPQLDAAAAGQRMQQAYAGAMAAAARLADR
ncbi:MAG TPA: hypothetical protein VFA26_25250 [Gemmataceae bacterium]|nr:hypothetical protein [Gemmataceae bacterium]